MLQKILQFMLWGPSVPYLLWLDGPASQNFAAMWYTATKLCSVFLSTRSSISDKVGPTLVSFLSPLQVKNGISSQSYRHYQNPAKTLINLRANRILIGTSGENFAWVWVSRRHRPSVVRINARLLRRFKWYAFLSEPALDSLDILHTMAFNLRRA